MCSGDNSRIGLPGISHPGIACEHEGHCAHPLGDAVQQYMQDGFAPLLQLALSAPIA